jgi:NAD(P)-dependent dehydrogenase (short-subunit alcohol dehydrogenase family)
MFILRMPPFPSYTKVWHKSSYPAISSTRPELSLVGKTAVITGGGSGIGLAISKSLSLAGIGCLAIIGRRAEILSAAAAAIHDLVGDKTKVLPVCADISRENQIDDAFSRISAEFFQKPIDILVHCAAHSTGLRAFGTENSDELDATLNVNVKEAYFVAAAFIQKARPDAIIINISVSTVHVQPFPKMASYTAAKSAAVQIFRSAQAEHSRIHLVHVQPGQTSETDMAQLFPLKLTHIDDGKITQIMSISEIVNEG